MIKKKIIVIGGGTAGIVIANNLQNDYDVTLIEKSEYKRYPWLYKFPLLIGLLFRAENSTYIFKKDIILSNGRKIPFFSSNVLGGASSINGAVHTFGSNKIWEKILKKYDLNLEKLKYSYNNIYTEEFKKNKITLREAKQNIVDICFGNALDKMGVKKSNLIFADTVGYGSIVNTCGRLYRTSVMTLLKKLKFKIKLDEYVEKVIFQEGRAVGLVTNKNYYEADSIILSAGVIGSVTILKNSIIQDEFSKISEDLAIGENIQDHTNLRVNVVTNFNIDSLNEISKSNVQKLTTFANHLFGMPSLISGTGATSGVQLDLDGDGIVDTRIHVVQFTETGRHGSDGRHFSEQSGFSLSITPIRPKSKGTISVLGNRVSINPNYLSDTYDIVILTKALEYCLNILKNTEFSELIKEIIDEDFISRTPKEYISNNIYSGHHLIGGCQGAINSNFQVKGYAGLYICDASILDEYPASNIHSSVVLLADIFSNRFKYKKDDHKGIKNARL